MKLKSLARQTDLIFAAHNGKILDRGNYLVISTPTNPSYHWGNYLVFNKAPVANDEVKWREVFKAEFGHDERITHELFAWDLGQDDQFDPAPFVTLGFEQDEGITLATDQLEYPAKYNLDIELIKIASDEEWEEVTKLQILCGDPKFAKSYEPFKRAQMKNYRQMTAAKLGHWWAAKLDGKIVADLGVFYQGQVARYQSVGTHPDYRRLGICQTLVYESALSSLTEFKVNQLVMEADIHYHAAKIYESVGFKPVEKTYSLSRY